MSDLIYIDGELYHAEDLSDEVLTHYGVPGMKWGKRKSNRPEGVSRKTNRVAKKDAKEFTQAKMFYGEGAGNRRKLIKAKVNQRSVDGSYKKAFDHHVGSTDMAKNIKTKLKGRELERGTVGKKSTVRKAAEKFNDRRMNTLVRQLDTNQGLRDNNKTIMRGLESGKINQKQARAMLAANQLAAANGRRINF